MRLLLTVLPSFILYLILSHLHAEGVLLQTEAYAEDPVLIFVEIFGLGVLSVFFVFIVPLLLLRKYSQIKEKMDEEVQFANSVQFPTNPETKSEAKSEPAPDDESEVEEILYPYAELVNEEVEQQKVFSKHVSTSFTEKLKYSDIDTYNLTSLLRFINREIAHFHFFENVPNEDVRTALCNYFFVKEEFHNFCPEEFLLEHRNMGSYATQEQVDTFSTGVGKAYIESLAKEIKLCFRIERSLSELYLIRETPHFYFLSNKFIPSFKRVLSNLDESRALFQSIDLELVELAELIISRVSDEILNQKSAVKKEALKNRKQNQQLIEPSSFLE